MKTLQEIKKWLVTDCEQKTGRDLKDTIEWFHYKNRELIVKNVGDEYIAPMLFAIGEDENNDIYGAVDYDLKKWVKLL